MPKTNIILKIPKMKHVVCLHLTNSQKEQPFNCSLVVSLPAPALQATEPGVGARPAAVEMKCNCVFMHIASFKITQYIVQENVDSLFQDLTPRQFNLALTRSSSMHKIRGRAMMEAQTQPRSQCDPQSTPKLKPLDRHQTPNCMGSPIYISQWHKVTHMPQVKGLGRI